MSDTKNKSFFERYFPKWYARVHKNDKKDETAPVKDGKPNFKGMTKEDFVKMLMPSAKVIEQKYRIPYKFMIAQMALETAWGKSPLFYKYFNVGGIRSFKPESEPHGYYWTWEHVKKEDLPKWDKYERDKKQDAPVLDKDKKPTGKIKIRVKLPFRHFPDLVSGLAYYVQNVLLNKYFAHAVDVAAGDPKKYASALQAGKVKYATDTNYVPKVHSIIDTIA